mmetsp:Transcript_29986/g.82276  ORF Transcript_29986/g.82276 Transcript_29986/m.82276 type:complete len:256 (-) Transcript_29986:550-1317(-)
MAVPKVKKWSLGKGIICMLHIWATYGSGYFVLRKIDAASLASASVAKMTKSTFSMSWCTTGTSHKLALKASTSASSSTTHMGSQGLHSRHFTMKRTRSDGSDPLPTRSGGYAKKTGWAVFSPAMPPSSSSSKSFPACCKCSSVTVQTCRLSESPPQVSLTLPADSSENVKKAAFISVAWKACVPTPSFGASSPIRGSPRLSSSKTGPSFSRTDVGLTSPSSRPMPTHQWTQARIFHKVSATCVTMAFMLPASSLG